MAFKVSLTASVTASSEASGSAIRFVNLARLARRVTGRATDDLHDLGQAGAVANSQGVLAPDPVEAFLRHAERDDDVHIVPVVLLRRVLERSGHTVALRGVVIDEIGDPQDTAVGPLDELEAGCGINAVPRAQHLDDVLHLPHLVLRALTRIDIGNVDDGLLVRVENIEDVIDVRPAVEEIADVELLEVLVAVELFVVRVGDRLELGFVRRPQHGFSVTPKIGARHRDDVRAPPRDELPQVHAELVVGVRRNMVELIDGDQAVVERLHPVGIDREAERRMGADEHLVVAVEKRAERIDLATVVVAGCIAEVPLRLDMPVRPETELGQRLVVEAGTDGLLRHNDDGLLQALIFELVERDEHERTALARRRR